MLSAWPRPPWRSSRLGQTPNETTEPCLLSLAQPPRNYQVGHLFLYSILVFPPNFLSRPNPFDHAHSRRSGLHGLLFLPMTLPPCCPTLAPPSIPTPSAPTRCPRPSASLSLAPPRAPELGPPPLFSACRACLVWPRPVPSVPPLTPQHGTLYLVLSLKACVGRRGLDRNTASAPQAAGT